MPIISDEKSAVYFETAGTGEPLVLIPGFGSGAWSWVWQAELADLFKVITFDPRGIGKSLSAEENGFGNLSIETFAKDVLGLLDALDIEKAHILGASFGGFVALEFALRYPERLRKLILACTTAGGKNHVSPGIDILRSFTRKPEIPLGQQIRHFFRPAFTERFNAEQADVVEKVCRLREENDVSDSTYMAQLSAAFSFDVEARLGEINHKTLVISGDHDNLVPMQNTINLAAKLPNAELRIIQNGSHMIFVENADEFNLIVSTFVRSDLITRK